MPPVRVLPPLHRDPARDTGMAALIGNDDAGFTVLEALVSFVLLAVVSAAAIAAVVTATRTSKNSTDRVNASNLAQQDLQAARALRYPNYPQVESAHATKLGGTNYTITRTIIKACPATPNYDTNPYERVTATVTWPPAANAANQVVMATEIAC